MYENPLNKILIKSKIWLDYYILIFLVMGYYHFIDTTHLYFVFFVSIDIFITFAITIKKKMLNELDKIISLFTTIAIILTIPFVLIFYIKVGVTKSITQNIPIVKCTTDIRSRIPTTHSCFFLNEEKKCHIPYNFPKNDVEQDDVSALCVVKIETKEFLPHLYYICNQEIVKKNENK
jgi:hypothetical protein